MSLPGFVMDRILGALRKIIAQEHPNLVYAGAWEYVVTSVNGDGTVNGRPTSPLLPLPTLNGVPCGALASGGVCEPTVGATFVVRFANQDGSRFMFVSASTARVATIDATERVEVGASAAEVIIAGGSSGVSRTGDGLSVLMPPGTLDGELDPGGGGGKIPIHDLPMQILNPLPGLITGGTTRVRA